MARIDARARYTRDVLKKILAALRIQGDAPLLKVGATAPSFEAPDQHGRIVKLSDFAGQTVVLWFYPKADTPG